MSDISKRFEQVIFSVHKKFISNGKLLPVKVSDGILIGDILLKSDGAYKSIWKNNECILENICLNCAAIRLANRLALGDDLYLCKNLYRADQEYHKYFVDSTLLLASYHSCIKHQDYFKADVLWARYEKTRDQAKKAKTKVQRLSSFK